MFKMVTKVVLRLSIFIIDLWKEEVNGYGEQIQEKSQPLSYIFK